MFMIPVVLAVASILLGIMVKLLGRWIKLPYTVMLFVLGILIGWVDEYSLLPDNETFEQCIAMISSMDPDFILYVFLPILVFDAAYEMDLHVFRKTFANAALLAGPGLVIGMLMTAALVMAMEFCWGDYNSSNWTFALMFGALISATDPVAVVALLQDLGTSKRFSTLVDGESLLNDGSGLVCFMMFYGVYEGHASISNPLMYFIQVVIISCIIGFLVGRLAIWFVVRSGSEEMLQNCIMVAAAYITFMVAQHTFDVSGVIALVTFGYVFCQHGRPLLKEGVNEFMEKFWGFLAYIANTMIFLIVGVLIGSKVQVSWMVVLNTIILFIGLNLIRYLMIQILFPILKRNGYGLSKAEAIILSWGGLRGALGMSMALMVSCNTQIPQETRDLILIYTAGIVTLTLCVNATTSKWLVNKLNLIPAKSASEQHIWNRILAMIRNNDTQMIATLKSNPYLKSADWKKVESKVVSIAQHKADGISALSSEEMLTVMRMAIIAHEGSLARELYGQGVLNLQSLNDIQESLSELVDFEGKKPLDKRDLTHQIYRNKWIKTKKNRITDACNLCRGYAMIQLENLNFLDKAVETGLFDMFIEKKAVETLKQEINNLITQATAILDKYSQRYPDIFAQGVTDKATRMLLASERDMVDRLLKSGAMQQESANALKADIAKRQGLEIVG